jgi:hypothetical protein
MQEFGFDGAMVVVRSMLEALVYRCLLSAFYESEIIAFYL